MYSNEPEKAGNSFLEAFKIVLKNHGPNSLKTA